MSKRVKWVITHNGVDHTFKTLKAARAADLFDPLSGIKIIKRIETVLEAV